MEHYFVIIFPCLLHVTDVMFRETNVLLFFRFNVICNGNRVPMEYCFVTMLPCLLHVMNVMFRETNILLHVT